MLNLYPFCKIRKVAYVKIANAWRFLLLKHQHRNWFRYWKHADGIDNCNGKYYFCSFYFMACIITWTGVGDLHPRTIPEMVVLIVLIIFTKFVMAVFVGDISAIVQSYSYDLINYDHGIVKLKVKFARLENDFLLRWACRNFWKTTTCPCRCGKGYWSIPGVCGGGEMVNRFRCFWTRRPGFCSKKLKLLPTASISSRWGFWSIFHVKINHYFYWRKKKATDAN